MTDSTQQFKIVIAGDSGVGKTNLLLRYAENKFSIDAVSTIGIEFAIRLFEVGGKKYRAQIWDTAGQEKFRSVTGAYFKGAHGALLVYDVTERKSFEHVERWCGTLMDNSQRPTVVILVGNKVDMEDSPTTPRVISTEEGQALADQIQGRFFEASARVGTQVQEAFGALNEAVAQKFSFEEQEDSIQLDDDYKGKANCCK